MDHSGGPHAEQDRETQTANSKEIDHQVDPEGLCEPHLGEDTQGRYEQSNDDSKNIAASHGGARQCPCLSNHPLKAHARAPLIGTLGSADTTKSPLVRGGFPIQLI